MSEVLIVGGGGREHTIGWKIQKDHPEVNLFFAPGNAGTASLGENLSIAAENVDEIARWANESKPDLVIVGPETPLANGIVDRLEASGVLVFGPNKNAAEIESSKAFAKAFMVRHGIPTARYASFTDSASALNHLGNIDYPIVIKASGLAAGKGVVLPDTTKEAEEIIQEMMVGEVLDGAGREVVIEERLQGDEVSLLAFTDGFTIKSMPPAQDHKRIFDGDTGPNTGGMGAVAPAVGYSPEWVQQMTNEILQPTIDGLRAEGRRFVGVLYAGLMMTSTGPRVLEFNCRFGDPETQVILPLLDSDLLTIATACAKGQLADVEIRWRLGAAACIVLASKGYPENPEIGQEITGLDTVQGNPHAAAFHAGTMMRDGKIVTNGGRVLGVTGWGDTLPQTLANAYDAVEQISFDGMQYREDIGKRATSRIIK